MRVGPVVEDEAEEVDVCALDGLSGEDVVGLEGDAGGEGGGAVGVELGLEAGEVLYDAADVRVLAGDLEGEMAD